MEAARDKPAPRQGNGQSDRQSRIGLFSLRLHHLLFIAFTLVAAVPLAVLAVWEGNSAFRNEIESVRERHLLVARNLTSTMSRYVRDVKAVFTVVFESGALRMSIPGMADLMMSLNVTSVARVAPDGSVEATLPGLPNEFGARLDDKLLTMLRALAAANPSQPAISQLQRAGGQPVFYIVKPLVNGSLGVGILATTYLQSLQSQIAFGDNGHAVITDSTGQVIAHPFKDWVAASRDISGVPVVAAMKRGETGVGTFFSPAFRGDMIAGYSVVPETGWGVMVPQPIAELRHRADTVNEMATIVAIASFAAAALMSWLIALYLARPVRDIAVTAEAVLSGDENAPLPVLHGWVPREIRRMGLAFNTMLQGLRRRAAEIRHALQQAEMSNQAKTQFLANMSHEIRTPLNGVVGMIELMRLSDLTEPQQRYIDQATQASQALLRLIDDILDLSRIEVGRLELEHAPFHLPSLVHDARMLFADQVREKNLSLTVSVPDDLNVVLIGDAHRLLQILTNLLGNAVKFTNQGGISINLSHEIDAQANWLVRFDVTDTGIGVPVGKQGVIFNAFSQGDSSMTRRYGGTGLGLSIARELCQMMGGEIGVESTVGHGSTFWFTVRLERASPADAASITAPVPRAEAPHPVAATRSAAPSAPPRSPQASSATEAFRARLRELGRESVRIMLVEDNAANMRVTQALLEALGCSVVPARDGLEAVARYRTDPVDLILMDCQMPEMDGYEATRAIRQIEAVQGHGTPIIALTAHAMEGSREASLEAGMNDQLTKPLTLAALTEKLLQWLAPGGAGASLTGASAR